MYILNRSKDRNSGLIFPLYKLSCFFCFFFLSTKLAKPSILVLKVLGNPFGVVLIPLKFSGGAVVNLLVEYYFLDNEVSFYFDLFFHLYHFDWLPGQPINRLTDRLSGWLIWRNINIHVHVTPLLSLLLVVAAA